ncbi:hypothetical protein [Acetobacter sp.]|uniref:hypothetical protein n=1 Tax=Acetobacter sp. TaxID=440 RepID=UPI0025BFC6AA|nr:hypothetical protein [Acetobacter sp.]MCH4090016.1 hypothetical protein [Acetobacter sp.]MCI1298712.1 hypothetical protein [Acetobacter sp.]MCI1315277.1 hypothetical protein [Acetobacter sp.]
MKKILKHFNQMYLGLSVLILLPVVVHFLDILGIRSSDPLYIYFNFGSKVSSYLDGSPGWVDPNAGATTQALGTLAARQWLSGHIPWWDSYSGMGFPLAAEMQNSALFFPFILLLHFANGLLYLKIALQIFSGLASYALFREMRLSSLAVFSGSVLMEMCGTYAWFAHGPIMPLPFLPLLLLGVIKCCRDDKKTALSGVLLVSLGIAGSIFAGFPETAYMNGLFALLFAFWGVFCFSGKAWKSVKHIVSGGAIGLLLSAPAWIPFMDLLRVAFLGQNQDYRDAHFLFSNWGQALFPYLFGPPLYKVSNGSVDNVSLWWHTGGYSDIALLFTGLLSLLFALKFNVKYRKLRFFVVSYLVLSVLKAVGFLPVSRVLDLIPGIRQCMFYVYISSGWWCALTILFVLVLDDLNTIPYFDRLKSIKIGAMLTGFFGITSIVASFSLIKKMYFIDGYFLYPAFSIFYAFSVLFFLVYGFVKGKRGFISAVMVFNTVLLFFYPTLCGVKITHAPDEALISVLKNSTRSERVVAISAFPPNYGAFYGIATFNYNYLPLPENFAKALDENVCAGYDPTGFFTRGFGIFCRAELDSDDFHTWEGRHAPSTQEGLKWLSGHNVGYLLYPRDYDVWRDIIGTPIGQNGFVFEPLNKTPVEGDIVNDELAGSTIFRVGVVLGTYKGQSSGPWHVVLCDENHCVTVDGKLETVKDLGVTWLNLSSPFIVSDSSRKVHYKIYGDEIGNPGVVALWKAQNEKSGILPLVLLGLDIKNLEKSKVFNDEKYSLSKISDTQAYFYSNDCHIDFMDRNKFHAHCDKESDIIRNELFYKKWKVSLNGKIETVFQEKDGFRQVIHVPAGDVDASLFYEPDHLKIICVLFFFGMIAFALVFCRVCLSQSNFRNINMRVSNR